MGVQINKMPFGHLVTTRLLQRYWNTLLLFTTLTLESKGLLCLPRPSCLTHTTFGGKPILPTADTFYFCPFLQDQMLQSRNSTLDAEQS